jgi:hypothetical protein
MQYLCIYKPAKDRPPTQEQMAEMGKLIEEMLKAGVLVATGGLHPTSNDLRVRLAEGEFSVTDGPFTEAKELVGGFALINARSKADIIAMTKRFLKVAGDGTSEVRAISFEPPPR